MGGTATTVRKKGSCGAKFGEIVLAKKREQRTASAGVGRGKKRRLKKCVTKSETRGINRRA